MGFLFRLLLSASIAITLGFGLSWYVLTDGRVIGGTRIGAWTAWPDIGQPMPNPYSRAYLARTGVLQLGYAEGVQFVAVTDDQGEALDASCDYHISGATPGAAFWTLVAADLDGVNIAASAQLPALHSDRIARTTDGSAEIHVSSTLAPGNWLEIAGEGPFQLQLTLYDAMTFTGGTTAGGQMPSITRVGCS